MANILKGNESAILSEWIKQQVLEGGSRGQTEAETESQSRDFLATFSSAVQKSYDEELAGDRWYDVRSSLANLSKNRAIAGSSPSQTATFVFSLKKPLFDALRRTYADDARRLNEETWLASSVLDKLGLV